MKDYIYWMYEIIIGYYFILGYLDVIISFYIKCSDSTLFLLKLNLLLPV